MIHIKLLLMGLEVGLRTGRGVFEDIVPVGANGSPRGRICLGTMGGRKNL